VTAGALRVARVGPAPERPAVVVPEPRDVGVVVHRAMAGDGAIPGRARLAPARANLVAPRARREAVLVRAARARRRPAGSGHGRARLSAGLRRLVGLLVAPGPHVV